MIKKNNVLIYVFKMSKDHFIESNTKKCEIGSHYWLHMSFFTNNVVTFNIKILTFFFTVVQFFHA